MSGVLCSILQDASLRVVAYDSSREFHINRIQSNISTPGLLSPSYELTPIACALLNLNLLYILGADRNGTYSLQSYNLNANQATTPANPISVPLASQNSRLLVARTADGGDCIALVTPNQPPSLHCPGSTALSQLVWRRPSNFSFVTSHQANQFLAFWSQSSATVDIVNVHSLSVVNRYVDVSTVSHQLRFLDGPFHDLVVIRPSNDIIQVLGYNSSGIYHIEEPCFTPFSCLSRSLPPPSNYDEGDQAMIVTHTFSQINQSDHRMTSHPVLGPDDIIYYIMPDGTIQGQQSIIEITGVSPTNQPSNFPGMTHQTESSRRTRIAAFAGGFIGGVLVVATIFWFCFRRYRKKLSRERGEKLQSTEASLTTAFEVPFLLKTDAVLKEHLTSNETESLLPTAHNTVKVFNKDCLLGEKTAEILPEANYRIPGYATRPITVNGKAGTLHYFPGNNRNAFLRNVNATRVLQQSGHKRRLIVQHHKAIQLEEPVSGPHHYTYFWITSPCETSQSLYSIRTGQDTDIILDTSDFAFTAWSVYSMLESLRIVHGKHITHLGLTPHCYFIDTQTLSDWDLGCFDQAHHVTESNVSVVLNTCSAPELFYTATTDNHASVDLPVQTASDIYSLGCVIYFLIVGRLLFDTVDSVSDLIRNNPCRFANELTRALQVVDSIQPSFRSLLENMLTVQPSQRWTAHDLAAYWKEAAGLYDDEDEEDEDGEDGEKEKVEQDKKGDNPTLKINVTP